MKVKVDALKFNIIHVFDVKKSLRTSGSRAFSFFHVAKRENMLCCCRSITNLLATLKKGFYIKESTAKRNWANSLPYPYSGLSVGL